MTAGINREDCRVADGDFLPYRVFMDATPAYLEFEIQVQEPIELSDFVRTFSSLAAQYQRFLHQTGNADEPTAKIYVRRIREGSIIAELIPVITPIIGTMESILIVGHFGRMVRDKLVPYMTKGGRAPVESKTEITEMLGGVRAIARDTKGKAILRKAIMSDDGVRKETILEFDTSQARVAEIELVKHYDELNKPTIETYANVLMVFFQSNTKIPDFAVKSGEHVIIDEISKLPRPVVYISELARQKIKDVILHSDENIFKKGFYVDVIVDRYNGKVAAYKVTNLVQIIDLPD